MAESKDRRNPGWYVGVGAFWLIAAWLVIAGLASIIPQIFPETTVTDGAAKACAEGLQQLEQELLSHSTRAMSKPGDSREQLDGWLTRWDRQVAALEPSCHGPEAEAAAELVRLRHGLRDMLRKLDREQGPRLSHIQALLGSVKDTLAP